MVASLDVEAEGRRLGAEWARVRQEILALDGLRRDSVNGFGRPGEDEAGWAAEHDRVRVALATLIRDALRLRTALSAIGGTAP